LEVSFASTEIYLPSLVDLIPPNTTAIFVGSWLTFSLEEHLADVSEPQVTHLKQRDQKLQTSSRSIKFDGKFSSFF